MAATENNNAAPGDLSDIKRKLVWRIGIAGLMIVGLLGGLALFDYFSTQAEREQAVAHHYTEPVPVPKKTVTQPVTPAEPAPPANEVKQEATPEGTAAPVDKSAPKIEPPPRPEIAAQPALPKPSQAAARAPLSGSPASPATPAKPGESRAVPVPAAPARAEPPAAPPQPSPPRLFSGFALQAGVFSDPRRAEELHAKLTLEGIPSTIESRVQVGPFKSKEEAEAARTKMKALGIDAVMLLPAKGVRR